MLHDDFEPGHGLALGGKGFTPDAGFMPGERPDGELRRRPIDVTPALGLLIDFDGEVPGIIQVLGACKGPVAMLGGNASKFGGLLKDGQIRLRGAGLEGGQDRAASPQRGQELTPGAARPRSSRSTLARYLQINGPWTASRTTAKVPVPTPRDHPIHP